MTPTHHKLVQTAMFSVHAELGTVHRVAEIRIVAETLATEHDFVRKFTTDWKRVAHDCVLRHAEQAQHLAQIVDEARHNEPLVVRMVLPNTLRRLVSMQTVWHADLHQELADSHVTWPTLHHPVCATFGRGVNLGKDLLCNLLLCIARSLCRLLLPVIF